jgi:uncharacterized repeat protein (TIGR01451 family)
LIVVIFLTVGILIGKPLSKKPIVPSESLPAKGLRLTLAFAIGIGSFQFPVNNPSQPDRHELQDQPLIESLDNPVIYPEYEEVNNVPEYGTPYPVLRVPSKQDETAPIFFEVRADPSVIPADGVVQFIAVIGNNSKAAFFGITYTDVLEPGMEFVFASENTEYNPASKTISYFKEELLPGEQIEFGYQIKITASPSAGRTEGEFWFHATELSIESEEIVQKTEVVFWIGQPHSYKAS